MGPFATFLISNIKWSLKTLQACSTLLFLPLSKFELKKSKCFEFRQLLEPGINIVQGVVIDQPKYTMEKLNDEVNKLIKVVSSKKYSINVILVLTNIQ